MLRITIPDEVSWDEAKEEFVTTHKGMTLQLEHSLVSLSKWESQWCKPFLSSTEKTDEETIDYVKCMTLTQNVPPDMYNYLSRENIDQINAYIAAPMTATTFSEEENRKSSRDIITAEIIYYWMFELKIPFECRKWHLNQLLTQIKVCNIKNSPPKKRSRREMASHYAALNAARRKKYNTTG